MSTTSNNNINSANIDDGANNYNNNNNGENVKDKDGGATTNATMTTATTMPSRFSDVGLDLLVVEEGVAIDSGELPPPPPLPPPPLMMAVTSPPPTTTPFAIVASEDDVVVDIDIGLEGADGDDEKEVEVEELKDGSKKEHGGPFHKLTNFHPSSNSLLSFGSNRQLSNPQQQQQHQQPLRRNRSTSGSNNKGSTNFLRKFISNASSTWTVAGGSGSNGGPGGGGGRGSAIDTRVIQSAIRKLGVDDDDDDDDDDDEMYSHVVDDDDKILTAADESGKSPDASSTAKSTSSGDHVTGAAANHSPPRHHLSSSGRGSASARKLGRRSQHNNNNNNVHRKKVTEWYSDRIQRALEYTGTQSYGIVGIEVWEYQQQSRSKSYRLRMPGGGRWISPYLQIGTTRLEQNDAINALLKHPRFVPPQTQTVGVGLEGELWSRAKLGHVRGSADEDVMDGDDMSSISFKVTGDHDDDDGDGGRDDLSVSRRSWVRSSIISMLDRSRGKSTRNNSSNALDDKNSSPDLGALEAGQKDTTSSNRTALFGRQPSRPKANLEKKQVHHHHHHHVRHSSSGHHHADIVAAALAEKLQPHYHHHGQTLVWRDMNQIFIDPDTPKCPRLEQQMIAGFGQAAAIPFKENGHEGIVIFLARKQNSTTKKGRFHSVDYLNSLENQEFLFRQAKMIGSLISNAYAGRALEGAKQRMIRAAWTKFARNLVDHKRSLDEERRTISPSQPEKAYVRRRTSSFHAFRSSVSRLKHVPRRLTRHVWNDTKSYMMKWKGGGGGSNVIPPPLDAPQSAWTWLGVFCGLLILSAYNEKIVEASDGRYELLIGPFGALMTLIYGLHSAPASQPRNVVLGQVVSGAVSLSFTYIPEDILPVWIRRAVGPAFSIAAMVKLGVTHPPAGAHSVIYAGGKSNWTEYFLVVLGASISVLPAVVINNLSVRRQYPVYWGYIFDSIKLRWRRSKRYLCGSRNKK